MPEECAVEMKTANRQLAHSLLTSSSPTGLGEIMRCGDFSTLHHLLRVTTYVVRFARVLIHTRKEGSSHLSDSAEAERLWTEESQSSLTQNKNFNTWKKQFNIFLDPSGVRRCGGRIAHANLPYSSKHPVLLSTTIP